MAYGHLFYGYYNYPDGTAVYVNIYKDGYTGDAYRIAHMQGLSLEIGGGDDPIYTPVVKTTLRFSMVDAFDIGYTHYSGGEFQDCVTGTGPYDKHGRWESFYTSNPTELKVELQVNNTVIWTGFVTPDSWEESMIYRGSITVVARDMLGTLSDRPFNATGTNGCISVIDLVNGAIQASQGAMPVIYAVSKFLYNKNDGSSLLNALIPVAAFDGKSWWDALTGTLEALGMVLRYNGANKLQLLSIRYIHETGFNAAHDSEFINRTGLRTLDPPVKEIAGEFELDIISKALTPPKPNNLHACNYTAQTVMLGTKSTDKGHPWGGNRPTVQPYELFARSGDWYWGDESQSRPPLFSPPSPAGATIAQNGINLAGVYFIANTGFCDDTKYTFIKRYGYTPTWEGVIEAPTRLTIRQDGAILMRDSSGNLQVPVLNDPEMADAGLGPWLEEVSIYIKDEESGKYYDGSGNWINGTEKTLSTDTSGIDPITLNFGGSNSEVGIDIPLPAGTTSDQLSLVVIVAHVLVLAEHVTLSSVKGLFAPLTFDISKPEAVTMPTEYSVRTVYNENYNVAINRNPALGCINTPLTGKIFKNVLLSLNSNGRPYPLPDSWNWGSGTGTGYPLEVLVQAQLLMLYASAMSIFTGDIHDKGTEFAPEPFAKPGYRFLYFERNCLLLRGTFDFVSGFIRGSALREYATWEQVWSSFNPQYNTQESGDAGPSSPGSSSGSGGSSGGGGGGGGGTGTVTSVNMSVPTGFTIGGNPITVAGTLALGFSTGYSLPLTADVNKGVTAFSWVNSLKSKGNVGLPVFFDSDGNAQNINHLNLHADDSNSVILPYILNTFAYLDKRKTEPVSVDGGNFSANHIQYLFDCSESTARLTPSSNEITIVVTPDNSYNYCKLYIDFQNPDALASAGATVRMDYSTAASGDSWTLGTVQEIISGVHLYKQSFGTLGVKRHRVVISGIHDVSYIDISEIGLQRLGLSEAGIMLRGDDSVLWRSLRPADSTQYTLGDADYKWNDFYVVNGHIFGNLRLKGSGNFGNKINFGDGEYVYIGELSDDVLTIFASGGIDLRKDTATRIYWDATNNRWTVLGNIYFEDDVIGLPEDLIIATPQVTIGSRREPISGGGAKFGTYLFVNHPKLGTSGYEWILMRRSKRGRKKSETSAPHFDIRRSGWSEAIGQGDDENSYNWDPLTGTAKYVDLDTLRDFIMRRFICTYDRQLSAWRNSAYLLDILNDPQAIDPDDRNYTEIRFGQTFPMGSGGSHSVTREKWRTMTRTIAQFGIAIRRVNPEFLAHYNPQQTLAKTTRQITYLDGTDRKKVDRYLYSEVVPLRCFINIGDLAGYNDRTWHLSFKLQDI